MLRTVLLVLLSLPLIAAPASAAAPDEAGAAHLKEMFTKYLAQRKSTLQAAQQELRSKGEITVERTGTYYAVTLPHISIHRADGTYTDIGTFAINVTPGDTANEWKMAVATPTPITVYDSGQKPMTRVELGPQSFNGVWNEDLQNFRKIDARYRDITVKQNEANDTITIKVPDVSITSQLTPGGDGKTWSGPVHYEASNIEVSAKSDPGISKIGRATVDMSIQGLDPASIRAYQEKVVGSPENPTPAQAQSLYTGLFDLMGSAMDGFDSKLTLNDVSLARPSIAGSGPGSLGLKQASIVFGGKGMRGNAATVRMALSYDALALTPPPAGFNDTVPSRLNFDVSFDKIPYRDVMAAALKNVGSVTTPEAQRAVGMQMAAMIPQMLTTAGSTAKIMQSFFGNGTYNVALDGQAVANLKTAAGATGKLHVEVTGFDKLLPILQERLKDPTLNPMARAALQKSLLSLTAFQVVGQQATNPQGQPTRTYDLDLNDQGKILVNGVDMSILGAMTGARMAPGQPAAPAK